MSFSKGKIERYYDSVSCAPPPGKYNPKYDNKVKGAVAIKGDRFGTPKLERTSSVESVDSACSTSKTPVFRTPSKVVPKRSGLSTPRRNSKLKAKALLPDKFNPSHLTESDQRMVEEIHELTRVHQNQLVEKDKEIADLMEQINGLNEKISSTCTSVSSRLRSEYELEINRLRKELMNMQTSIVTDRAEHGSQVSALEKKISELMDDIESQASASRELENSLLENSVVWEEMSSRVEILIREFNSRLDDYVESIKRMEDINRSLMDDYSSTMDRLKVEAEENLTNKEMIMELQEKVERCTDDLDGALKRCKMYEKVQTETSKTINVLSKRLMSSELEVDKLTDVHQDLLENKNKLEEQVKGLFEENQGLKESFVLLQESVRIDVETVYKQLLEKVESYKQLASAEAEKQRLCIQEKQNTVEMLLSEIEHYKLMREESEQKIVECHDKLGGYQEEIARLKGNLEDAEIDYEQKIEAQKALFSRLTNDYENLKIASNDLEQQLNKKVTTLETICVEKDKEIAELLIQTDELNREKTVNQVKVLELENERIQQIEEVVKLQSTIVEMKKCEEEKVKIVEQLTVQHVETEQNKTALQENNDLLKCELEQSKVEIEQLQLKYQMESQNLLNLKQEANEKEENNQKYLDEIIADLVLEKERVKELATSVELMELQRNDYERQNESLRRILEEKDEALQVLELERLANTMSMDELIEEKEELVKTIERQNREIEALSETADRHYAARKHLEQQITALTEERDQLSQFKQQDSARVSTLESQISDLEARNRELNEIMGPFMSQLKQFELERNFLLSKSEDTEKELEALAMEHARSLGHQNHKQKIKHVSNLYQTISSLKKELEKFRLENIKLRHEITAKKPSSLSSIKKNKENRSSEQIKTGSALSALKDRNA